MKGRASASLFSFRRYGDREHARILLEVASWNSFSSRSLALRTKWTIVQEGRPPWSHLLLWLAAPSVRGPRMFGHWFLFSILLWRDYGGVRAAMTGGAPLLGTMVAVVEPWRFCMFLWRTGCSAKPLARPCVRREGCCADRPMGASITRRGSATRFRKPTCGGPAPGGIDGEAHVGNVKAMMLSRSGKLSVIKIDPCNQYRRSRWDLATWQARDGTSAYARSLPLAHIRC